MTSFVDQRAALPAEHSNHSAIKSGFAMAGVLLAIIAILAVTRSAHYLLFHTMAEIFAIVVSLSIFILTWTSNRYLANGYLIVLGGAYGAIGLVDIFHTLTFRGMNLFPGVSTNYPTQFWLTARYLEAIALLWAPLMISRKPNFFSVSAGFAALAALASVAVVYQWFPATFIEGIGLTPFKIYSEYVIIAMLFVGFILLYRFNRHFERRIFFILAGSLWLAIATEFCFTRYAGFYDFTNELGHYFRFLSVSFAFVAVVLSGVRKPFDLIFREMDAHKHKLDELNRKLTESEARFKLIFNEAPLGIALMDSLTGHIHAMNPMFARIAGRTMEEMAHIDWMSITHPDDVQKDLDNMTLLNAGKIPGFKMEKRYLHHDGTAVWINMTIAPVYVEDKTHPRHLCMVEDITERKQMEDQVRQLAFYDVLTKLPNRRLLSDRLSQAMASSKRSGFYGALMFLDLDNFKLLNDTHGHEVGDLLLIEAAHRLKSCTREMDTVARFGGDEFVVMIGALSVDKPESTTQACSIAEKIRTVLAKHYVFKIQHEGKAEETVEHQCTTSIGVALFFKQEASQSDILKWADTAMYQAKESGRNLIRFFDPSA